jgi:FemAB family
MINYFTQTRNWIDNWLKFSTNHKIHELNFEINSQKYPVFIYEYPWHFGLNFLYIAQAPVIHDLDKYTDEEIIKNLQNFFGHVLNLANNQNSVYIKWNLGIDLTKRFNLQNNQDTIDFFFKARLNGTISDKIVMYNHTVFLSLSKLVLPTADSSKISSQILLKFFEMNREFWLQRNRTARYYTQQSLKLDWIIDTEKNDKNFQDFYKIYKQTCKRQKFAGHSYNYLFNQFQCDSSRLILIKNQQGNVCSVWLGWVFNCNKEEKILTYLHGGNNQEGFDGYSQYLMHLVAMYVAVNEKVNTYDMGGYIEGTGFGKFKEHYKGELIYFAGPIEWIQKPIIYKLVTSLQAIKKMIKI